MKRILILVFAIFWLLSRSLPAAETARENRSDAAGLGIGGLGGALIGGPPGAIIGAAGGAWFGQRTSKREVKMAELEPPRRGRTTELAEIKTEHRVFTRTALNDGKLMQAGKLHDGLSMPIFFRTGSAEIEPNLRTHLERLGILLTDLPDLRVNLSGYADRRGSEADNMVLSAQRLSTVRTALERSGVQARRIHTRAYGEFGAAGEATDPDAMAFDRTVIIRLHLDTEV